MKPSSSTTVPPTAPPRWRGGWGRHTSWNCRTDATSGFRALRHDVARLVDIRSTYTYTTEMLLAFSLAGVPITFVPIRVTRQEPRPSRLIRSNAEYLFKTTCMIVSTLARRRRCTDQAGSTGGGDELPTRCSHS